MPVQKEKQESQCKSETSQKQVRKENKSETMNEIRFTTKNKTKKQVVHLHCIQFHKTLAFVDRHVHSSQRDWYLCGGNVHSFQLLH
jgi:hypothetical protein